MTATLEVLMLGRRAGTLSRLTGGRLTFRYHAEYRGTPLSVSMPLGLPEHTDGVVSPWLAGLLPDNEGVIGRWSREFRVGSSPFALLGTQIGHDCAGAVQFASPDRAGALLDRPGTIRWLTERELADRLRTLARDTTAWLGAGPSGQFSLAGAQAKTALRLEAGRWGEPSGAAPTSHILKPSVPGLDDHDLNEHLCLSAARRLGMAAAATRIERFEDQTAIVVTRYDRVITSSGLARVHQEDLCQALSVSPASKYESDGGPGVRRVVALLNNVMPPEPARKAVSRFTDALIFNWLIAGTDAHAKNYSLLLSGDEVRLAPLYDIASALPYPGIHERKLRLAMRLGRDYHVWPHHDPWPRVAADLQIGPDRVRERVDRISADIAEAFSEAGRAAVEKGASGTMPTVLTDRVADRTRRCRRVMGLDA